jgi:uncharacterized membrane protein required for colicin V production
MMSSLLMLLQVTMSNTLEEFFLRSGLFVQGFGSVSGFIISMYVAYLLVKTRLTAAMSSYHIYRKTLMEIGKVCIFLFQLLMPY